MPRLNPGVRADASRGFRNATSRMKPKYNTIMARVSLMAMRHRAAFKRFRSPEKLIPVNMRARNFQFAYSLQYD
tara:strand:+ start:948 stop:1169 length:222 start_codon:yes stop_codon:yes gene_type:complete